MANAEKLLHIKSLQVKPGKKIVLSEVSTDYTGKTLTKATGTELLDESRNKLEVMQDKLYAHNQYSVLIILQAMDAAGKDGAVKHIMSGFNPLGVKVYSFKAPNAQELDHDFLWRHELALPARGEIAIHNRSHYENVLVTRVHPEFVLKENIPGIESLKDIDKKFWQGRFKQIRRFEKNLADNGMIILKFFLHLSRKEQKKRLLDRIDDPHKNWKFSIADLRERTHWDDYMQAYGEAISETSTKWAPWFIIPADDKWFARLAIATVIDHHFAKLDLAYPKVSDEQLKELKEAKKVLENEGKK